jgi:septum site-determining protein MinD
MAKSYVIISGKGGAGKTTTAVNLGAAMNKLKEDVVILDANLTTPNVGLYFGAPIVPVNLNHVLKKKAEIEEAIYEHESGTKIIPSSLSLNELKKIKYNSLKDVVKKLKRACENIILDCAAGLGEEAKAAMRAADEVIVVANPNILSATDALKTIKLAEQMNRRVRGVIITRVRGKKTEMPLSNIKEMLETKILGVVPEDKHVEHALLKKNAVIHTKPSSKAARSYEKIAARLLGKPNIPKSAGRRILDFLFS